MAQRGRPPKKPTSVNIENALDIAQAEINKITPKETQLVTVEKTEIVPRISADAVEDYNFARTNITTLLNKGSALLEGITVLAIDSDHPRTYEVAANLMKILIDGNRELLALQKDIRDVEKKETHSEAPLTIKNAENVNTNFIFEGTSMDILEMREMMREKRKLEGKEE